MVEVDIDTDSNNDRFIDEADDPIEDNDLENLGKRIFINLDDDNKNGRVDCDDTLDSGYHEGGFSDFDNDFAEINLDFAGFNPADLAGYELWLSHPDTLAIYWSMDKRTVVPGVPNRYDSGARDYDIPKVEHTSGDGTRYKWVLGPGVDLPEVFYVEGRALGTHDVSWRLVNPATEDIIARDTVNIKVEQIVWPSNESGSGWQDRPTVQWDGFALAEGWYISSSLCDIINGDWGYIRTHHPVDGGGCDRKPLDAQSTRAYSFSDPEYANGAVVTVNFTFDGTAYVQGFDENGISKGERNSFFRNSGIYAYNQYEVNIFDTKSMMDSWNIGTDTNTNNYVLDGELYHKYQGKVWHEPVSACMTGIPYRAQAHAQYTDSSGNDVAHTFDWSALNAAKSLLGTENVLVIQIAPPGTFSNVTGVLDAVVTLNGVETFCGRFLDATGDGDGGIADQLIHLQSHWCSGVQYSSITITPRQEE